jgi:hypothetical protein
MTETLAPGDSALPSLARHLDGARPDRGGIERQGMRLSLSHIADGEWRAQFKGDNQVVAPKGFGVAPTPWRAVQIAAWDRGVGGGEDSRRAKWLSHS